MQSGSCTAHCLIPILNLALLVNGGFLSNEGPTGKTTEKVIVGPMWKKQPRTNTERCARLATQLTNCTSKIGRIVNSAPGANNVAAKYLLQCCNFIFAEFGGPFPDIHKKAAQLIVP